MSDPSEKLKQSGRLQGSALREAHLQQIRSGRRLRARDAAEKLGVSECELLACGDGAIRLTPAFAAIVQSLAALGEVMALSRNEHCVQEKHGRFDHLSIGPGYALVSDKDIALQMLLSHWRYGFAVSDEGSGLRSLQFFDIDGGAVHKVYLTEQSDGAAFDSIVARFQAADQSPYLDIASRPARLPERPDRDIDAALLRTHWRALQDADHFETLLSEFGVSHAQALRLAGRDFAHRVEKGALRVVLESAAETQTPILCRVGNPGCIQTFIGPIKKLMATGPWFNILDPGFNLHLREDAIAAAWVVRKPSLAGVVTSLELFDAEGFRFAQVAGARQPGEPEPEPWRQILQALPHAEDAETR